MSTTYTVRALVKGVNGDLTLDEKPEDEKKTEVKEHLKSKFIDWSQSSTSHGYPNIFRTKNPVVKVMWLIFFLAGLGVGTYMVVRAVSAFLNYEVTTTIRNLKNDTIVFPTISICNRNPFITDAGAAYIFDYFREKYGDNITTLMEAKNAAKAANGSYAAELEMLRQKAASPDFDKSLRTSFGYSPEELFIYCSYNAYYCSNDDFERYYDPFHGNCYRFNSGLNGSNQQIPLQISSRYAKDGLTMILFSGPPRKNKSYLFNNYQDSSGLQIVIHDQGVKPTYSEGLLFKPGTYNRITLTKVVSETLPKPYSNCQDLSNFRSVLFDWVKSTNYTYRQSDCFDLCYQQEVINQCGCYDTDIGPLFNATPCLSTEEHSCLIDVYYKFKTNDETSFLTCEKECPLECSSIEFNIEKSFAMFPSADYEQELEANEQLISLMGMPADEVTSEIIERSVIGLEISYHDIEYTSITEQESVTLIDLIANIGGTLGLFIGISLLSFMEIIEIFIKMFGIFMCTRFRREQTKKDSYVVTV